MRILMVNTLPLTGSGSGVYATNMANALIRKGHEVHCIFLDNEVYDNPNPKLKVHPIYFTKDDGSKPNVDELVLPFNFPCFTTHPRSHLNYRDLTEEQLQQYTQAIREAIAEEVEKFQPDVIHSGHVWISSAIAAEFDKPLVVTCHGTDIISFKESERYHSYAKKAADSADAIVCISKQNIDLMLKCFPEVKDKTFLMPNGYDTHKCHPVQYNREEILNEFGIKKPYQKIVGFAGKYTYFKGIDVLLKAAAQYEDGKTATILAGDGELFTEMQALAKKLNLKDTYLLGFQPYEVVSKLNNIADVALVPSRGEAFGLVVIEAGACGTPVIGTNDGGIKDILTSKTGILIDPDDPDALARGVKDILSGKKKFDREYIAKYTKDTFSQDSLINKTIDLYTKLS